MLLIKRAICIAVLSFICFVTKVYGQSFGEYRQMVNQQFENRRHAVHKEYEAMRKKVNMEFSEMLGREWKPSGDRYFRENPLKKIPSLPQRTAPDIKPIPIQKQCEPVHIIIRSSNPIPPVEIVENPDGAQSYLQSTFYGSRISVRFEEKARCYLQTVDPSGIKTLWNKFAAVDYSNMLADFYALRQQHELCDWASLKLSQKISEMVYGNSDTNESVILQSYLLSQCGLMTCLLQDQSNKLHLLVATDKTLTNYPLYNIYGKEFFQVDCQDVYSCSVPQALFDNTVPLRMSITHTGNLGSNSFKTDKGAAVNRNDIDFYSDYPFFFDDDNPVTAFYHVAQLSLSEEARNTLYPYLKGIIHGMSEVEAVQAILIYFYVLFPYREDEKVWVRERYFFPEETLYYEYSDCEDRAILFTRIVRDILGLKTAVLYMPGHLSAAVRFNDEVKGDAVVSDGDRYVICDPTYINSSVGQAMPGWAEEDIEVIVL